MQSGDRVQWEERCGKVTCTGKIICRVTGNLLGEAYSIAVDDEHRAVACHGSYEMHSGWVERTVEFANVRLLTS